MNRNDHEHSAKVSEPNYGLGAVGMQSQAGASIHAAAEPQRSPYEVGDALHMLSGKYAGRSDEHRLLREGAHLIANLLHEKSLYAERAERAEQTAATFNARIKLARLALDAVHIDG